MSRLPTVISHPRGGLQPQSFIRERDLDDAVARVRFQPLVFFLREPGSPLDFEVAFFFVRGFDAGFVEALLVSIGRMRQQEVSADCLKISTLSGTPSLLQSNPRSSLYWFRASMIMALSARRSAGAGW